MTRRKTRLLRDIERFCEGRLYRRWPRPLRSFKLYLFKRRLDAHRSQLNEH